MSNNRKRQTGGLSPLTVIIRVLIVIILLVAIVITVNRIAEINQNAREKKKLAEELCLEASCGTCSVGEEATNFPYAV